jgi:membrane protease YdiL (CAAX protease family)
MPVRLITSSAGKQAMRDQTAQVGTEPSQFVVGSAQTFVTLGIVLLFGLFPVLPRGMVIAAAGAIALLAAVGWCKRWVVVPPLGAFCCGCIALALFGLPSQLSLALGIAAYAAVEMFGRGQRRAFNWFTAGTFTREVGSAAATSFLVSAVALIVWFQIVRPDINDLIVTFVPDWHWALVISGGLLFSMLNAGVEEMAYRGVLMDALDRSIGAGILSVLGQATAFGVFHINGFPRGWIGVGLASIFGAMMGLIRRLSRGLLAAWAAHVCTDVVIISIVLFFARA